MAKIRAHGNELGTIYTTTAAKRHMSDGTILSNCGFGWKLHAKVKDHVDPVAYFEKRKAIAAEFIAARPCLAAYRKELHAMAGLSKRWKLHAAIELMPEDCDGVWSEVCDGYGDNIHADVDEVGELCRLYLSALAESKTVKATA